MCSQTILSATANAVSIGRSVAWRDAVAICPSWLPRIALCWLEMRSTIRSISSDNQGDRNSECKANADALYSLRYTYKNRVTVSRAAVIGRNSLCPIQDVVRTFSSAGWGDQIGGGLWFSPSLSCSSNCRTDKPIEVKVGDVCKSFDRQRDCGPVRCCNVCFCLPTKRNLRNRT